MTVAAAFHKGYLTTTNGQIHYREVGEGPALVLLHQNPSSSLMWVAVMPGLAASGRRVIAIDTPGYGHSDSPPTPPSISYYAERIAEAISGLGIEQFDLLGHHTGALIAAQMAVDIPERVKTVTLVGYPILSDERRQGLANAAPQEYSADGRELAKLWQGISYLGGPKMTGEIGIRCLIEKLQAGTYWNWAYNAVSQVDPVALASRIAQPTLLIAGEHDPIADGNVIAATIISHAKHVVIAGGGVNVADDEPDQFVQSVVRFLTDG